MSIGTDTVAAPTHTLHTAGGAESPGGDLQGLMSQVLKHLTDAERRNEILLAEMKERLEALSHGARMTRARVPNDYLPGFERIEDGIHLLADRIAHSYMSRQATAPIAVAVPIAPAAPFTAAAPDVAVVEPAAAPALVRPPLEEAYIPPSPFVASPPPEQVHALSSTSPGLLRARTHSYAANVDTFDVIESLPGNPTEAWSPDEAAALSHVYSSREALFAQPNTMPEPTVGLAEPAISATEAPSAPFGSTDLSGSDRSWIDQRLGDIATRVERSLAASRSDVTLGALEDRFTDMEHRLTTQLSNVATKADLDGLTLIEDQLHTLRSQFEQAHVELLRIDDLERQLGHLVQQVSDDNLTAVITRSFPAPNPAVVPRADVEFHGVAIAAAEAAAARVSRLQGTGRVDDVHALLSTFISERRHGEEQTAITLDTLQQAMLRILDRVEAFEHGAQPLAPFQEDMSYHHNTAHESHDRGTAHDLGDVVNQRPDHGFETGLAAEAMPHHSVPAQTFEPIPAGDYLSQQRAKMQASVQRAAAAQREKAKAAADIPAAGANARTQRPAKPPAKAAGSGRLMVSMLALAVMAGGGAAVVMTLPRDGARTVAVTPQVQEAPVQVGASQPRRLQAIEAVAPALTGADTPAQGSEAQASIAHNPMPETVTEDIGQSGLVPEIDRVPDMTTPRANMARSQFTVPTAVSGVLLQTSAPSEPIGVRPIAAPARATAPAVVAVAAHPGDMPSAALEAVETEQPRSSLELPPATVGPLSLRLAAARGDKSAQFEVASRLAEGKGTDQNLKEAVRWYQRSATQGFTQAQYRLGTFYERGLGIKADAGRARTWYQRAAEQGNVKAMHNLAVLAAGRSAESPDYSTAAHWFTQAASYGLADSQFNLAVLMESGLGVDKDLVQATKWFSIAARSGDKEAIRRRDLMKSKLQPSELAKADGLAKTWQPMVQEKLANDPHAAGEAWKAVQVQPMGRAEAN
jgi:localization factor PodJL